ncbi:MAG: Stk1 family PASTA domain-containing Ser/Thr kinase [Lachnospiraceae bacterium]|nr:Stk1 family PASTA domain-containing Ser/Thr kinase [Lachnospiraceae bacterium]
MEKIGTGGMSDVYKAKDHKLNRFVAVKVLKQEFSENANFVSKFRVEAQAAAGLMHPNIVNVYDVGQEDGVHFIVMELVEGITLKKYIEKKARLSFKEAVSIAIQVCMGIEAAHNNHIIHRDIKPQNVIISKEGKVKVTDFGIAKAATSNTITSNVMGSVHYTSPEQARGGYSDEKSDIYSLGVTLFEMITGRVPFNGETTVAIAIKHIQEQMPSPREFVQEIPVSVEQIVLKCCQKSPDRRYQNMAELIRDLKQALMNPDQVFVDTTGYDEAGETKTLDDVVALRTEREVKAQRRRQQQENAYSSEYPEEGYDQYEDEYYEDEYYDEYDDEYYDDDYDDFEGRKKGSSSTEKLTTIIAIVAAVIIGVVVIVILANVLGLFGSEEEKSSDSSSEASQEMVEMIDVVGKKAEDVKNALLEYGLTPVLEYEESYEVAEGLIISCSVKPGEQIPVGSEVVLTISAGEKGIEVPNVVGMTEAEAVSTLLNKGFKISKADGFDGSVPVGSIFKQSPEGNAKAPADTTVSIFISKGPEENKVTVPNICLQDEMTAMAILTENGLTLGQVTEVNHSDPAYTGLVCVQSIEPGTFVEKGTAVDISVSIGPKEATYKFVESIQEPNSSEDPNYKSGTLVTVSVMADDGTVLMSTQTTSFPLPEQSITGIKSPTGIVKFQYVNQGESSTVTNDDGSITTIEGTSETKEFSRPVTFIQEEE